MFSARFPSCPIGDGSGKRAVAGLGDGKGYRPDFKGSPFPAHQAYPASVQQKKLVHGPVIPWKSPKKSYFLPTGLASRSTVR